MSERFGWGHININVKDLDVSIDFYRKLGFKMFIPGIPYLDLNAAQEGSMHSGAAAALGMPPGAKGRACIMGLGNGFPKIDLTELSDLQQREPLGNQDLGLVRLCLASQDLATDYEYLKGQGVEFLSPPETCHRRLAEVATCKDPDGTLIELLQIHLERWPTIPLT